jgi:hypothetical protein
MNSARIEVIRKIKKLLSLAEGQANLNEALAAAEIAQRLILLHAVADSELHSAEVTERNLEPIIDFFEMYGTPFGTWKNPPDHIQVLFDVIAGANSCAIYVFPIEDLSQEIGHSMVFSIVGQKSSIEYVYWFAQWMNAQIFVGYQNQQDLKSGSFRDFYLGSCKKLQERLSISKEDLLETAKQENISKEQVGCAIIRLDEVKQQVAKKMEEMSESFGEESSAKAENNIAFARGFNEADKLLLETQKTLESKTKKVNQLEG